MSQDEQERLEESRFYNFCRDLQNINLTNDADDADYVPPTAQIKSVLIDTLSGIITKNAIKILENAQAGASSVISQDNNPSGLTIGIESGSESKFRFLAKKLSKSSKRFRYATRQHNFTLYLLAISLIALLFLIPSFFNPLPPLKLLAEYGAYIAILSFIIAGILWALKENNVQKLKLLAVKYSNIDNLKRDYEEFKRTEK